MLYILDDPSEVTRIFRVCFNPPVQDVNYIFSDNQIVREFHLILLLNRPQNPGNCFSTIYPFDTSRLYALFKATPISDSYLENPHGSDASISTIHLPFLFPKQSSCLHTGDTRFGIVYISSCYFFKNQFFFYAI